MKIGIVIREPKFQESGGGSFVNSILNESKRTLIGKKYDFVFCYRGKVNAQWKTIREGITYINITSFVFLNFHLLFKDELRNVARNMKRRLQFKHSIKADVSYWDLLANKEGIDLYWFTFPDDEVVSTPYIYTLWDLGHRTVPMFPEESSSIYEWESREQMYQRTVFRASYILTGNEVGKKEIIANYSIPAEKIRIVPFPISDFCYGAEKKPDKELPKNYFFYPATFWAHKNHICIIEALSELKEKYNLNVNVVFSGGDCGQRKYVEEYAKKLGVFEQVCFLGYVTTEEIKYLYKHAIGMIYASLMGPNNLPPLEAAYLSCPVIITDLDGHKEQLGDAALYFNGLNSSSLSKALYQLLNDDSLREALVKRELDLMQEYQKKSYIDYVMEILDEYRNLEKRWK